MSPWIQILHTLPLMLFEILIQHRLLSRTLGRRYSAPLTLTLMFGFYVLMGWMNLSWGLAGTIPENTLYYGALSFVLYLALFQGDLIKTAFLVALITFTSNVIFHVLVPLCFFFFGNSSDWFLGSVKLLEYFSILLWGGLLEYAGHKFRNLRNELPKGYTAYLTAVVVFVALSVYAMFELTVIQAEGNLNLLPTIGGVLFAAGGLAVILIAISAVDRQVTLRLGEQKTVLERIHFKEQEKRWRQTARFRHDLKNHLICLEGLLVQEKKEQALSYLVGLSHEVEKLENFVQTGNDYADALLNAKYADAISRGIRLSLDMHLPPQGYGEPADLCCILSNAMDNAIEACQRISGEGERWITGRAFLRQKQLIIEVKNALPEGVVVENGKVLSRNKGDGHGFGLESVAAVVERYGGVMDLAADSCFTLSILLPPCRS